MICDIGVDICLQGHLVHPTPSLNLRGNHEPERERELPTVTWPTAEPDTFPVLLLVTESKAAST